MDVTDKRAPITREQAQERAVQDAAMLTGDRRVLSDAGGFVAQMRAELRANAWKGPIDRYGATEAAEQLLYHAAKAARAIMLLDPAKRAAMGLASLTEAQARDAVREATADAANEGAIAWFSLLSGPAPAEGGGSAVGDASGEPACRRCGQELGTPHAQGCAYASERIDDSMVALDETTDVPVPGWEAEPAMQEDGLHGQDGFRVVRRSPMGGEVEIADDSFYPHHDEAREHADRLNSEDVGAAPDYEGQDGPRLGGRSLADWAERVVEELGRGTLDEAMGALRPGDRRCTCPVGFGQVADPSCPRHPGAAHTITGPLGDDGVSTDATRLKDKKPPSSPTASDVRDGGQTLPQYREEQRRLAHCPSDRPECGGPESFDGCKAPSTCAAGPERCQRCGGVPPAIPAPTSACCNCEDGFLTKDVADAAQERLQGLVDAERRET